jgi:hypothetical protein
MKKLVSLFILINSFSFCYSQLLGVSRFYAEPRDTIFLQARVVKISRIKHAFTIEINDISSNKQYLIVSLNKKISGYHKLKKNRVYAFKLWPYCKFDVIYPNDIISHFIVDGIELKMKVESRFSNFYLTPNLIGKHYVPLK